MSQTLSPTSPVDAERTSRNLREHRGFASCERCKLRKLKCDRERPSCQRCAKVQEFCEYPSRKKPGFPAGQRQHLEGKINMLEAEVHRLRESSKGSQRTQPQNTSIDLQRQGTEILDPPSASTTSETDPPILPTTLEKTSRVMEREPPSDLLFALNALFFRHIHPWLPFLDAQRVFANVGATTRTPLVHLALFGVSIPFSQDTRLDNRSRDAFWTHSKRRIFVDILEEPSLTSLEALTILVMDLASMTTGPQVWGALSIAVKLSSQLRNCGNRVLRVSAEDHGETVLNSAENTRRQRLFWAIYALDSFIAITTSLPSDLQESQIHAFLPSRYTTWRSNVPSTPEAQENTTAIDEFDFRTTPLSFIFNCQLELLDVSRKIHRFYLLQQSSQYQSNHIQLLLESLADLENWSQTLPRCLHLFDIQSRLSTHLIRKPPVVMLHLYHRALLIHLNGIPAFSNEFTYTEMTQQRDQSQRLGIQSLEFMVKILAPLDHSIWEKLGWPVAWAVWVAARFVLCQARVEGISDTKTLNLLLEGLKRLSRYWQIAGNYLRLLKRAITEFETRRAAGGEGVDMSTFFAITDLQTPTSDLEDQARPDPVSLRTSAEHLDPGIGLGFDFNEQAAFGGAMADDGFNMSGGMSDNWCTALLFPSSTFQ